MQSSFTNANITNILFIKDSSKEYKIYTNRLICSISADTDCVFSLWANNELLATSIQSNIYFIDAFINNKILFKAGSCLENHDSLKGLSDTNLCSWRYSGLTIRCNTNNVILTINTIPIDKFISVS